MKPDYVAGGELPPFANLGPGDNVTGYIRLVSPDMGKFEQTFIRFDLADSVDLSDKGVAQHFEREEIITLVSCGHLDWLLADAEKHYGESLVSSGRRVTIGRLPDSKMSKGKYKNKAVKTYSLRVW